MRINLLGSCQVVWQDRSLAIPRRQTRALLYCLAARLEPVPRARIAFLFWPDTPDAVARRQLTRLLSSLRAALPRPDLLLVDEENAALNPALVQSDSQQLAAAGVSDDPAILEAAVALYRGHFMAGFDLPDAPEYEAWQAQTARQLEATYLALLERLVELYTAATNASAAIRCAQRYLAVDELAEVMHRRLIGLYMAAGDRAAAQRQYEQCALLLERELGVSPLPETQAALLAVPLRRAAASTLPLQPSLELPMTGREAVLVQLENTVQRLRRGGLILIHGEPGVGKTRLLRDFADQHASQALVMAGASYPGSQALPYHPLLQALRTSFDHANLWRTVPAPWLSELLPLLPDLRVLFPDLPAPPPAAPSQAQARVLAALTQTLIALARHTPVLLCLDDLPWADEGTLGWLRYMAGRWEDAPLVVLATAHSKSTPALVPLWPALSRAGRLAELKLDGLAAGAIQRMLSNLPAPPSPTLVQHIHRITGGNPLFVLEIVRELQGRNQLHDPPTDLPLPATVRDTIIGRVSHLTSIARQVLEAAAVLDPLLEDTLLQHTSARSTAETADALDELLAHQFLQIGRPATSALAFPHSLMPSAIYQALTPWRRKLLHGRAADALAQLQPDNAAAMARHCAAATAWETAIAYYRQAAQQAASAAAYDTALELVNRAIDLLPNLAQPDTTRLALLRQRLTLQRVLVHLPDWQSDAVEVLRLAELVRDDDARLDALEAQISLHVLLSDFAQVEATAAQALALAQETANRVAEARIRQTLGWHLADALGRSRAGLAHLEEACRLAEAAGAQDVLYQALCNLAFAQRAQGQCEAARASALQALALTPYRPGDPPQPAFADAVRELGEADAYLGRWEEALRLLRPLLDLYQTLNDPWAYGAVLHNYGLYCASIGQHGEAVAAMRSLVALSQAVGLAADSDYGIWHRAGLARALLAAGEIGEAGELLASLRTDKLTPGRPYLAWARAAAEYRLAVGDVGTALDILQQAVDWWRRSASLHDVDVLLMLARAALITGDKVQAQSAVEEARARLEGSDMRRYHLRLYATIYAISGDPVAMAAVETELASQAAGFSDPELRATFVAWATQNAQGQGAQLGRAA
jgi:DNA-binding SARP family transcriptional activator